MFTGIIEEIGVVKAIRQGRDGAQLTIAAGKVLDGTVVGDSIAVNGVCLTVTSFSAGTFTADAMHETLSRSTLGTLSAGDKVNLERAMAADGRFGGHIVAGHVDACCRVISVTRDGIASVVRIGVPPQNMASGENLLSLIAVKGSVTLDGASLTVTAVDDSSFSVSLIPHTGRATTLGSLRPGDQVNVEADVLARYVSRALSFRGEGSGGGLTMEFLAENGF